MKELSRVQSFVHNFLPHPHSHQKARLLHWHYLIIYILLFLLLKTSLNLVETFKPGILGVDSNIKVIEVIDKTNQERKNLGLKELQENSELSQAAYQKAQNMFAENYWAHYAPSGKDPWSFIKGAGYKFSYAGENLAKSFYSSDEVVKAWMNSPTHRENIVNPNYQDIGIAVVEGTLQGQKTTLIVQMFGRPYTSPLANVVPETKSSTEFANPQKLVLSESQNVMSKPLLNPYELTRIVGLGLLSLVGGLYLLDLLVLKLRGVFRLSTHHLANLSFLALSGFSLLATKTGEIL